MVVESFLEYEMKVNWSRSGTVPHQREIREKRRAHRQKTWKLTESRAGLPGGDLQHISALFGYEQSISPFVEIQHKQLPLTLYLETRSCCFANRMSSFAVVWQVSHSDVLRNRKYQPLC